MPDLGPDPHREETGPWGPGEDTELIHVSSVPDVSHGLNRLHWPWSIPSVLLITARLGSLGAGVDTKVWETIATTPGDSHSFWFAARRSSGGATVNLSFGHQDNTLAAEGGATVEWLGGDHLYAWAGRFVTRHPFATGTIYAAARCEVVSGEINGAGANEFIIERTAALSGEVTSTAPSDLRVEYVASWWNPADATCISPSATQLANRLKFFTCQRWFVGFVGTRG